MHKLSRRSFVKLVGAGGVTLGTGISIGRIASAQAKTITFAGSVPLSGRAAETGLNVYNGYQTAVKFFNEELGGLEIGGETYQLKLEIVDDASDPARAVSLYQRFVDDGVDFFLGSFGSNIVLPTVAVTDRANKPMMQAGGGSDKIFTQGYKYVFGMFPRASKQFLSSVEFFKSLNPAAKTISVIFTNDAFSKFQADGAVADCQAAGFELLDTYQLPEQVSDVSSVLASVREKTPDILICTTHDQDSLLITKQMIGSDTNVNMLYQTLGPQLASYREALGNYANDICVQIYWDERAHFSDKYFGSPQNFADYYRKNFDRPLAYHVATAGTCIVNYAHALQNAGKVDPQAVRDELAKLDVDTIYGRVRFTDEGDGDALTLGANIGQVQNTEVELVYPEKAKTADVKYPAPNWQERA
jgi:branched-chain amino acid transport system substrate-binding protein